MKAPILDPGARAAATLRRLNPGAPGNFRGISPAPARPPRPKRKVAGAGSAPRWATLVIASSTTSDSGKRAADLVCDGANVDDQQIQELLWTLRPNGSGTNPQNPGRVVFLEGRYKCSGSFAPVTDVVLDGMGRFETTFEWHGGAGGWFIDSTVDTDVHAPCGMYDLGFDGGDAAGAITWDVIENGGIIENCYFEDCPTAIRGEGASNLIDYYVAILGNLFSSCGSGGAHVIDLLRRTFFLEVIGNSFDDPFGPTYELWAADASGNGSVHAAIAQNNFGYHGAHLADFYALKYLGNSGDGNFELVGSDYCTLTGNVFGGNTTTIDTVTETGITGNSFVNDLDVLDCDKLGIAGNTCAGSYTETTSTNIEKAGNVGIV